MSQQTRSIWDELVEIGRKILERLDDALHPDQRHQKERARVPVPVHNDRRLPRDPQERR